MKNNFVMECSRPFVVASLACMLVTFVIILLFACKFRTIIGKNFCIWTKKWCVFTSSFSKNNIYRYFSSYL